MKINEIKISGLFGMFDHLIPLNTNEHITIIYGINGIGKTMLFRILDSFFNSEFHKLANYPFNILSIIFDDNSIVELVNEKEKFDIYYKSKKEKNQSWDLSKYKTQKIDIKMRNDISHFIPVSRISSDDFIDLRTDEIITIEEAISRFENDLPPRYKSKNLNIPNKKELDELIKKINLFFIQTQRLLAFNLKSEENYRRTGLIRENAKIDTVLKYSRELSQILQEKHKEYAKKSEEYEISLGKRLRSKEVTIFKNLQELKEENEKLENRRKELKIVGLLENIKEESIITKGDSLDQIEMAVLSVNIQDMKKKLQIFDDIYTKLYLFLDILNNRRFSYKKISIDSKKGFVFKNDNGETLDVTELSSGEQHEIVLLFDLLFKVNENSLVLIDEPEISLHIVWQKEFLSDLKEITSLRKFDILVATHSPSIINGNWDLTVELKKEQNETVN